MPNDISPQSLEQWKLDRIGKCTASRVADVIARTKAGWGASRANYAAELIAERLTGAQYATYTNADMKWGTEQEPKARAAYAFFTGREVIEIGFVPHPQIDMSGASPDGLVEEDGLLEIKCPKTSTHLESLLGEPIEKKYITQMMWQMSCTGRKWCDFVSFDPRLPPELQLKIQRVPRDEGLITELGINVIEFLGEIDAKMNALTSLMEAA